MEGSNVGMIETERNEQDIEIKFAEVEKQCDNWRKRGFKIMVVYQPITGNSVATDFYKSMLSVLSGEVWTYMADNHKIILKPYVSGHFPIDANRNMAVIDAKKRYKADYMFFMDTDQTFPPLTIPTLYAALVEKQKKVEKCVMAGMYFTKKDPWNPVFGQYAPWDKKTEPYRKAYEELEMTHEGNQLLWWKPVSFWSKGQIFPVDVIGAGCMMMPMSVFDEIRTPHFKYLPDFMAEGKQASEDMWFCASLKKAGIPIFMNSNVGCGHLTQLSCDEALFTNQRDGYYRFSDKTKAASTYENQLDVRTEAEREKWKSKTFGTDKGDE